MRVFNLQLVVTIFALAVCLSGCGKSGPPSPLTDEEWGPALTKAFEKAPAQTKALVQEAITQFDKKDYVGSGGVIGTVLAKPTLTDSQRATATMAQRNLNEKMRAAESKGDTTAVEVNKFHQFTK